MIPHGTNPQSYQGEQFNIWLAGEISETKGHVIAQGVQLLSLREDVDSIEKRHEAEDQAKADALNDRRSKRWDVAKSVALVVLASALGFVSACLVHIM